MMLAQTIKHLVGTATLFSFALMVACNKDHPVVVAIDPCKDFKSYTGDFKIYENVADTMLETDTTLMYNSVTFEATGDYDSYSWKIGNDPSSYTEKRVTQLFTDAHLGHYDITLTSTKKRNTACFPSDPETATVTKSFDVVEWKYASIAGTYIGHFGSTPTVQDTVKLPYVNINNDPFGGWLLYNINKGCNNTKGVPYNDVWSGGSFGMRMMEFYSCCSLENGCKTPHAFLYQMGTDTLRVDFSFSNTVNQQPPFPKLDP